MQIARYKRYSINLDDNSRDQCGILASYLTVSMSDRSECLSETPLRNVRPIVENRITVDPV